jgi:hypothetical protein
MKSSFHSRTLAAQLTHFLLFLIIFDCLLKRLPQFVTAGLGSSLYSLGADPTENTVSWQSLYCCVHIRCRGNVFTEPLLSSRCLLWLHYSGFQALCHNILNLGVFQTFCKTCSVNIVTCISDYRRGLDWMFGFIGLLVQSLVIAINYNNSQ